MEQMVKCANCGTPNPPGQQFCGKCGAKLVSEAQPQRIKCPNCGFMNIPGQQFCGSCGARLVAVVHQAPAVPSQQTPSAVQQVSAAPTQQVSTVPAQEVTTVPAPQAPARVVRPAVPRQQVDAKPTWGLAWGLWWRMLVLSLLIFGVIYALFAIVMVLAFNYKLPFVSGG
jgi:NMD protein affecting ribosome stability and mRNA decay